MQRKKSCCHNTTVQGIHINTKSVTLNELHILYILYNAKKLSMLKIQVKQHNALIHKLSGKSHAETRKYAK